MLLVLCYTASAANLRFAPVGKEQIALQIVKERRQVKKMSEKLCWKKLLEKIY